tara:strand:- start:297 stop:503 length:207 start_codon:yes stop_codon:yes gene_type:complete
MNVQQLIEILQSIEDKTLPIRVIEDKDYYENGDAKPNFWLSFETDIELNNTGQSGYEMSGEVRLIGSE